MEPQQIICRFLCFCEASRVREESRRPLTREYDADKHREKLGRVIFTSTQKSRSIPESESHGQETDRLARAEPDHGPQCSLDRLHLDAVELGLVSFKYVRL